MTVIQAFMIFFKVTTPKLETTIRKRKIQEVSAHYHCQFIGEKPFKMERANQPPLPGRDSVEEIKKKHIYSCVFKIYRWFFQETKKVFPLFLASNLQQYCFLIFQIDSNCCIVSKISTESNKMPLLDETCFKPNLSKNSEL